MTQPTPQPAPVDDGTWVVALALADLWEGEMVGVCIGDLDVLLIHLGGGEIRAYDNRCPHAGSRLSEGHLRKTSLLCGWHLWEFDVRTGAGLNPSHCSLMRYPVRVMDGNVWVRVPRAFNTER